MRTSVRSGSCARLLEGTGFILIVDRCSAQGLHQTASVRPGVAGSQAGVDQAAVDRHEVRACRGATLVRRGVINAS